jgi:perosamine synthetase
MWRMGVPVSTPVTFGDFLAAVSAVGKPKGHRVAFENDVRTLFGETLIRSTNSGRTALFFTLQAMKQTSPRDEVVIPAFVCPSVGRAVVKAGLKPVLCDVGPNGSGLDIQSLGRLLTRRTLAVVTAHLFGYPAEVKSVIEISHYGGALVIEDAAQAFGAKLHGRFAGTFADAGIFSFEMSKVLWSNGGGLIVTSDPELGDQLDRSLASAVEVGSFRQAKDTLKFGALAMLVRRHNLGPLAAIWSHLMRSRYDTEDFAVSSCSPSQAAIARALLSRMDEITRVRRGNAAHYSAHLSGFDQVVLPEPHPDSDPVFLRFPIIVPDVSTRNKLLTSLRAKGINASEMYSRSDYKALRGFAARESQCPQAEYLTHRMLNLPTHPYMRECDLGDVLGVFQAVLRGRRVQVREAAALAG